MVLDAGLGAGSCYLLYSAGHWLLPLVAGLWVLVAAAGCMVLITGCWRNTTLGATCCCRLQGAAYWLLLPGGGLEGVWGNCSHQGGGLSWRGRLVRVAVFDGQAGVAGVLWLACSMCMSLCFVVHNRLHVSSWRGCFTIHTPAQALGCACVGVGLGF